MYTIIGKDDGKKPDVTNIKVDLEVLGLSDESETMQGRVVTHELTDGTYIVRSQGYGPKTVNYSGEFDGNYAPANDALLLLRKLRGRPVTILKGRTLIGTGHVQSVNPASQTRLLNQFIKKTWRIDIIMDGETL